MRLSHPLRSPPRVGPRSAALGALLLSGCAFADRPELAALPDAARYALHYDHVVGEPGDVVGRALANCPDKTTKAETACVREAIDDGHLTARTLAASIPGCRLGTVCQYDRTTHDRLGFIRASATGYVKRWRVTVDLRGARADAAGVPITVVDRDDFTVPDPATSAGKPGPAPH